MMRSSVAVMGRRGARSRKAFRSRLFAGDSQRSLIRQGLVAVGLVAAVGLVFLYLWQSWRLLELSTQVSDRRTRVEKLKQEIENLEYEVSSTFTVERIRQIAKEQLGMVEPEIETVTIPLRLK